MSALVDVNRETRIIRTIVCGNKSLRAFVLSNCEESLFGYEPNQEILRRVIGLCQIGEPISLSLLSEDRKLSRAAKDRLQSKKLQPYATREEAKAVLADLSRLRTRRSVFQMTDRIGKGLQVGDSEEDLLAVVEAGLMEARSTSSTDSFLVAGKGANEGDDAQATITSILRGRKGASILTGIPEFDSRTGGYQVGNLVIKMAQRGGGKSSQDMAENIDMYLKHHYNVCCVNLEMSNEEFWSRVMSNITNIPYSLIARGKLTRAQKIVCVLAYRSFHKIGVKHGCRFAVYKPKGIALTSEQLTIALAPMGFDVISVDHLRALAPNPGTISAPSNEQYESHARVFKQGLAGNRFKPCVVKVLTHMTEDWSLKYSRAVEDWADFIWAWRMSRRDRTDGIVRIRQMKARNSEEYPFNLHHDLSVHRWKGPKDKSQWSINDGDDFETDRIARQEQGSLESSQRKTGQGGWKGKAKDAYSPPKRGGKDTKDTKDSDDLGLEEF